MTTTFSRTRLITIGGLLLAGTVAFANGTRFSDFTPLAASAAPVPPGGEDTPITFGNPNFSVPAGRATFVDFDFADGDRIAVPDADDLGEYESLMSTRKIRERLGFVARHDWR